ncbi:hypothetical protein AMS68_006481 [Peltaster fructicola]|uniref:SET domain-containing protein n=1 Tax=Peltaster fructicola TaxID=286661 RepID=A0A6H0Y1T1_9PEZI|nr:hypothetical protein AMS68_006481 [Peltaster fructicola]
MTDTLASSTTLNGSDLNPLLSRTITDFHYPATVEDDGQISCFCGLNEDDGNTVACDICNKWQHIRCYYPQWAEGNVPDDLQHFCVECKPREFDSQAARARQANARSRKDLPQNGVTKRPASKTKKKPAVNGWPLDKRHDRTSASPREQGPPAKRPKTTHRPSNSTHQARKRSASAIHPRSISASPETSPQTYSHEFISAYQNDSYTTTSANCLDNLEIGAKFSSWLNHPEEIWKISGGLGLQDIFQRYDGDINVIDPPIDLITLQETYDDRVKTANGQTPMWKVATLKDPISNQSCIGELRGHVGFKEDYKAEPANRWSVLKHPEPFVFFHPYLPICIDARNEGTLLRYVRRSCDPNAELKVIITGAADYHFCFIATRDIEAGEEVAIAWDCARTVADMIRGPKIVKEDIDSLQQWISLVLSNCGPCACKRQDCLMARFDKRFSEDIERAPRAKARRKKDIHISPLNTHAVNSRSGSEVRRFEDDERDSRSATGSGKGSDSRDITPNTHYSTSGHIPEVSERERKKLAKEEEMFRRQEEQAIGKQTKKKRTSGGNTLDIPKSASSKQSPGLLRRMDTANGRVSKPTRQAKPATKPAMKRTQSIYVDAGVQCEMDAHETVAYAKQVPTLSRRRMAPLHQRLLDRCAQTNAAWKSSQRPHRRISRMTDDDGDTSMANGQFSETIPIASDEQSPANTPPSIKEPEDSHGPDNMKLTMPPPAVNPFATQPWTSSTPLTASVVESPAGSGSFALLSPSVQASLGPTTPAKKKMSLSDYTKRNKAKEHEGKPDRDSSPSSTVSGPITVQPAVSTAPSDDTIMEDSGTASAV